MTVQENRTHELVQSACKKYIASEMRIDWEQRRYEIAKDILCALIVENITECSVDCQMAVIKADQLIEELKKSSNESQSVHY